MVEMKGLAITAGARPIFSASSGREQPTHLANTLKTIGTESFL